MDFCQTIVILLIVALIICVAECFINGESISYFNKILAAFIFSALFKKLVCSSGNYNFEAKRNDGDGEAKQVEELPSWSCYNMYLLDTTCI